MVVYKHSKWGKKKRRRSNSSRLQIPSHHPTTDQKEACIVPE